MVRRRIYEMGQYFQVGSCNTLRDIKYLLSEITPIFDRELHKEGRHRIAPVQVFIDCFKGIVGIKAMYIKKGRVRLDKIKVGTVRWNYNLDSIPSNWNERQPEDDWKKSFLVKYASRVRKSKA